MSRKKKAEQDARGDVAQVEVAFPIGDGDEVGYHRQLTEGGDVPFEARGVHLNVQLGTKAATAFVRVRNGLRSSGAKLADGRPVWSNADALRYIFEAMAEAAEEESEEELATA